MHNRGVCHRFFLAIWNSVKVTGGRIARDTQANSIENILWGVIIGFGFFVFFNWDKAQW